MANLPHFGHVALLKRFVVSTPALEICLAREGDCRGEWSMAVVVVVMVMGTGRVVAKLNVPYTSMGETPFLTRRKPGEIG